MPSEKKSILRRIPTSVWAIGFVSMFMDTSSEAIHALLPVYLVSVMGASVATVGLIEGISEATASITKVFSGVISDWLGKRKLLTVIGYGMAALTKPLFPLASSTTGIFAARFIDRIGKGIRGAPRDALIGEIAPPELRGASYGLRQSLDTVGAFIGPLIAVAIMALTMNSYLAVFWFAVIPAFIAVAILIFFVKEPAGVGSKPVRSPIHVLDLKNINPVYWWIIGIAFIFTVARFSEAFLVLRASGTGLSVALIPFVLIIMNIVYSLSSYPAGALSDRINRWGVLAVGFVLLAFADLVLGFSTSISGVLIGTALWGLHMGITQGVFSALIADTSTPERRGTAFGIYNLSVGIATIIASVTAGLIWDAYGAPATFFTGAAITMVAIVIVALMYVKRDISSNPIRGNEKQPNV